MNAGAEDEFGGDFPPEGWEAMDGDEKREAVLARRDLLRRRRAALVAEGPDTAFLVGELDRELGLIEAGLAQVEPSRQAKVQAEEAFLQSTADVADAMADSYAKLNPIVRWMILQFPNDPRLNEIRKTLDQMEKDLPAELVQPARSQAEWEEEMRRQGLTPPPPPAA